MSQTEIASMNSLLAVARSIAHDDVRTALARASMSDDTRAALAEVKRMSKGGK